MSKVKATRRPKRSAAKSAYFVVRGRRVRVDQIELVIPQADGSNTRLIVDKTQIRYQRPEAWTSTTYEHETLTASLG